MLAAYAYTYPYVYHHVHYIYITIGLTHISLTSRHSILTTYLSHLDNIYIYPRPPTLGPRMSSLAFGASTPTQTTSEPVGVSRYDWFLTQSKTLPLGPLSLLLTTCVNLVCRPSEQPPLINYGYACSKLVTLTRERMVHVCKSKFFSLAFSLTSDFVQL